MINVAIVDDEKNCIDVLEKYLFYCHQEVNVVGKANSVQSAIELIDCYKNDIDILFLDIHMPGGNGFNVITSISEIKFKIVFTTAFDQYAINAIRFSALDYLLKPIDQNELQNTLNKFESLTSNGFETINQFKDKLVQNKIFDKLGIPSQGEINFVELKKILYLESDKNYTHIYLENGEKILASKNLGYFEDLLSPIGFIRTHSYFIVNCTKINKYIKGRTGFLELENGTKIEISAKRKDELFRVLNL